MTRRLGLGTGAAVSSQLAKLTHALGAQPSLRRLAGRLEAELEKPLAELLI